MKYIAISLFIIFCVCHLYEDHKKEKALNQQYNYLELKYKLEQEQFRSQRQQWWLVRDSIGGVTDSLITHISLLTSSNRQLEAEIKNIRGRYNKVSADSLSVLMNSRANANR